MQANTAPLAVVVDRIDDAARSVKTFDLVRADGGLLPAWTAGAHIDVTLENRMIRSYSLIGPFDDLRRYRIAVALDASSRGGSSHLHHRTVAGSALQISAPRNHFALDEGTPFSTLIAGGIGITPLWAMVQRLNAIGQRWRLHYAGRSRASAAFVEELEAAAAFGFGEVDLWFDDEQGGRTMNIAAILREAPPEGHLYCCGPAPMLAAFRECAGSEASDRIHLEYFRPVEAVKPDAAFVVELARSGRCISVPAGSSILDALMMNGVDAPYSCYEGLCGTCETRVLEGIPDHRDHLLTDRAKAENKSVIICCSGSLSPRLVLDL
jgi:vanillate O-demethylase ferredoxin subunit